MYNTVIFVARTPLASEFEVPDSVNDVAMEYIADYFTGRMDIPKNIAGADIMDDGSFRLTSENIECYFAHRYMLCKKLFEQATLSDFCEGIKDGIMPIELIINEDYETYIVFDYDPDDLTSCYPMTLDSFLRSVYHNIKHDKEYPMYIVGCCGYHC